MNGPAHGEFRSWRAPVRWVRAASLSWMLFLSACAVAPPPPRGDLELTWSRALVYLPHGDGSEPLIVHLEDGRRLGHFSELERRGKMPAVIYMHGCTGIGDDQFFRELASKGYVVIVPDSFARTFRPLQCDPLNQTGGENRFVYDFRLAEVAYTVQRLPELPWIDTANLFLMGTSEGGVAAALYRGDEFKARVIAQWTCNGAPIVQGIAAPPEEPVLAMVQQRDPWYDPTRTKAQTGHCGEFMDGRPHSRSIVLERTAEHDIFGDPENVELIMEFLSRVRRLSAQRQ